jgi:ribosomal-protein-alanine N-acetyltransferase
MTPEKLAAIHERAMDVPRPWSAVGFEAILKHPGRILTVHGAGFALGRVILDEAELLTLAVDPKQQRKGIGRICLDNFHAEAREQGATKAFLEVAATNEPARALYLGAGYQKTGVRKAYYRASDDSRIDAILMTKSL